jgi:hypothetical protein
MIDCTLEVSDRGSCDMLGRNLGSCSETWACASIRMGEAAWQAIGS